MTPSSTRPGTPLSKSRGLLVLGMHRSGTSLLARLLQQCGIDIGGRLLGGSAGNEHGHWEDAFAVELHERLLASMGRRWDEVPVPSVDVVSSAVSKGDRDSLARYLGKDRALQRLWAVKDPRLSLFSGLWVQAAGRAKMPLAAMLMVRHPVEVAQSLAVRDGIPRGQGLLLWLDYTIAALERAGDIPLRVGTYDELMASPARLLERVRSLPGWRGLKIDPQALADVVQPDQRHHHSTDSDDEDLLPGPIRDLWRALQALATDADGKVPAGFAASWRERLAPFLGLAETLAGAWRVTEQRLWERVARAESTSSNHETLEGHLANLEKSQLGQHEELVRVLSDDIRRMQHVAADSQADAARLAAELASVRHESPGVEALVAQVAQLLESLAVAQSDYARVSAALGERQAQLDSACTQRETLVQQVAERQRAVEATAAELAEHMQARAQLVQTVTDRQAAIESLQSQLAGQMEAREELVATVADRQAAVEALHSQLAGQVVAREELVATAADRQTAVEALQSQLAEQLAARKQLVATAADRQTAVEALQSQLAEHLAARKQLVATVADRQAAVEALQSQLAGQLAARKQLVATVAERQAAVEALQSQLAGQLAARNQLVASVADRQAAVEALQSQLAGQVAAREELVASVADRQGAVEALHSQLAEQLAARKQLVATVAERQAAVEALHSQLAEQVRRCAELVDLVGKRQACVEVLQAQAVEQLAARQDLAHQIRQLRGDNELLQARMRESFEERTEMWAEIQRRQDDADAVRALADLLRDERDDVAAQKREVERELEAADARAAALLAELHAARHECAVLRESDRMLRQVVHSRSWRWTRPLRAVMRLMHGDWGDQESATLRGVLRRLVGRTPGLTESARRSLIESTLPMGAEAVAPSQLPDQGLAPALHLAAAGEGFADVFVWAVIDWHFRMQRPQHLARSLAARGHRVFYISNNFVDSAEPGFHVDPLDGSGRLFQVHLNLAGAPMIYFGLPAEEQTRALHASLAELLGWTHSRASISLVQHPYWSPLLRSVPNAQVVYDCMDHHGGFENNAACVLEAEEAIIRDADLVIVTSSWLEQEIAPNARATAMIRNAGEYDFFSVVPEDVFRDPRGRQVIGYYGAIAEWFDLDLIRAVAHAHPQALVLLVGNDTAGAASALADVSNVEFTGEVPYARLPYFLYGFDIALLPFRVIPLTLATNPVKVYEYLAAGKPVVVVDLPEMVQFEGLVTVADSASFADAVGDVLGNPADPDQVAARRAFAAGQTWDHRAASLDHALALIDEPVVSVVVLTYNNLAFTEACLFSIEAYSDYPQLEVIVVDNASSDGSPEWLRNWAQERSAAGHRRRLVLNEDNLGFSAGNNVGLAAATGEVLILLNNDTYVTPGWVRTLCSHLRRDPSLGLVGPITNNIGNEARIEIQYPDLTEMIRKAGEYTRAHPGRSIPLHNAAFFCVAMPRGVYEAVGPMDEDFGVGFFEDDDYCRRVHLEDYRVACAEDVFVHHHLSASFDSLGAERKQLLFEKNKAIYEAKWGAWTPHVYRAEDNAVES